MRGLQKFAPLGIMDKDTDVVYVKDGSYLDAKNVQHLTDSTGSTQAIIPMKGNIQAFDLGSIASQNKTYRLYTEHNTEVNPSQLLFYMNGTQFGGSNAFWLNYYSVNWFRSASISAQASAIKSQINVWDAGATVFVGNDYVDITLSTVPGGDYTISATDGNYSAPATVGTAMEYTVIAEAYDTTLQGELKIIGSYDLLGDLYVWSTTGTDLPLRTELTITNISLAVAGTVTSIRVDFSSAHGLDIGQSVNFLGNVVSVLDGDWIVSSYGFGTNSIILSDYYVLAALPASLPTTATITLYKNAIGEIGVAQYTATSDTWAYTRLARTKQWGFRLMKQADTYCEQTSVKSSIYWTDDFNVPRCLYYIKEYNVNNVLQPFEQDGVIAAINSTGLYTYETIVSETKLQLTASGAQLSFVQQLQAGGHILSGNWRYSIRFLTDNLIGTECTDLTNPINVCVADLNGDPTLIIGDEPDTVTSKINQLEVTGILPGLFKYIELIGVNYVGSGVVGYSIKRVELSSTQDSITLNHIGTETDTTDFDLGLLGAVVEEIATAKNIDVIDKRMILSNITTRQQEDFTNWAQSFTHSLLQLSIDSVRGATQGTLRAAEYMLPENVNGYVGYMQNETYRFGVKVKLIGGGWTNVFHIDDICFTTSSTNVNANGIAVSSDPTRRVGGLPSLNLTDSVGATTTVYVPYVRFENINLGYKIDGVSVLDLIEDISIMRVECIPEILCAGVGVLSVYGSAYINAANANAWVVSSVDPAANPPVSLAVAINNLIEYPFVSGREGIGGAPDNPQYPNNAGTFGDNMYPNRKFMALYSPDVWFGNTALSYNASDIIINYGAPSGLYFNNGTSGGTIPYSGYAQYSGNTGVLNSTVQIIAPTDTVSLAKASSTTVGSITFTKNNPISDSTGAGATGYAPSASGYLVVAASDFSKPNTFNDYGLRYIQYYRPLTDKYSNIENSTYISCDATAQINSSTPIVTTIDVFGGDTFTQLNYFKHRYVTTLQDGLAGGLSFYSQNRVNAQMKQKSASQTGDLYPAISTLTWLESPADTDGTNGEAYQEGYTIRNEVKSNVAFDEDENDTTDQPARFRWSAIKPQGSANDQHRAYLPLDYHDLDQSFGEIVHHANANGELISWQQRAFMRQYFNTRGTLEVKGITEVLIGDGSVMSRDGVTVSRLGSKHKWSIIKGKSQGGNDVFYWLNTELKKALRFGYDGTVSVGDVKGMQSFLANNLKWVDGYDTPANGAGICGVWDDRYANAMWTVNGVNSSISISDWTQGTAYTIGSLVYYPVDPFLGKQYTYSSLVNSSSTTAPSSTNAEWELVPNVGTYFNKYTLVFNEFKNGFTTFATHTPSIYLKWTDTFLSPRPISPVSIVYQHNLGDYLSWYGYRSDIQTERGYIQFPVNELEDETKWMEAIGVDSEVVPIRFEFETKNHESFLADTEFEGREDSFYAPVKNDSTGTGINDNDTSSLYGKYMKAKMFFEVAVYQKLVSVVTKFRVSPRYKSK